MDPGVRGVDVALVPINGKLGNLDGPEAARLARTVEAALAVPCHYGMFEFNTASPDAFAAECDAARAALPAARERRAAYAGLSAPPQLGRFLSTRLFLCATVRVMTTRTPEPMPSGYDPSQFPAFAVTVDIVILTMSESRLHVLLVRRGVEPFQGLWAVPGGFKRPNETLDEAATRELREETSIDGAALLTQFGAYGDPGRDPRMNVVTVAYLAVLPEVTGIVPGTDASHAALVPVSDALDEKLELAFDHARILRDAVERVRVDLELRGIATAFVGPTFTLAELRTVYEAVWGVQLDGANFRRSLLSEGGWVIPTGRRARPGASGGKPAELFRAGQLWQQGGPIRFPQPSEQRGEPMRAVVYDRYGPPEVLRVEEVERPVPKPGEVLVRVRASTVTRSDCGYRAARPVLLPRLHRAARAAAANRRNGARGHRRGGRRGRDRVRGR